VFQKRDQRLEVFTANRRALEKVLGVDLIYLNERRQNIVMLQYKMLDADREDSDTDWIYRPDAQLDDEISRMKKFAGVSAPAADEYRLNPAVFYLKFVKRNAALASGGIILPLDHFEMMSGEPAFKGPRGGLRVSYNSLGGRYMRNAAFLELVRSGYIGAHAALTDHLKTLIEEILSDNHAVIAAIESSSGGGASIQDEPEPDSFVDEDEFEWLS